MTSTAHTAPPAGVKIRGPALEASAQVLTPEALEFVGDLVRCFRPRVDELLARRVEEQAGYDAGKMPCFRDETAAVRQAAWKVAPIPPDLADRRVEITSPVHRKMIVNAINSGASVFMADTAGHGPTRTLRSVPVQRLQERRGHRVPPRGRRGPAFRADDSHHLGPRGHSHLAPHGGLPRQRRGQQVQGARPTSTWATAVHLGHRGRGVRVVEDFRAAAVGGPVEHQAAKQRVREAALHEVGEAHEQGDGRAHDDRGHHTRIFAYGAEQEAHSREHGGRDGLPSPRGSTKWPADLTREGPTDAAASGSALAADELRSPPKDRMFHHDALATGLSW